MLKLIVFTSLLVAGTVSQIDSRSESLLTLASQGARSIVQQRTNFERQLAARGISLVPGTPGIHNRMFRSIKKSTAKKAEAAELALQTTLQYAALAKKHLEDRGHHDSHHHHRPPPSSGSTLATATSFGSCFDDIRCSASDKYRTIDGSCNNLRNSRWGQAEIAFIRLISPDYADGISASRVSSTGADLPSARTVSQSVTFTDNNPHRYYTHMVMQWGQFLDHDITLTPFALGTDVAITCCTDGQVRPASDLHDDCLPIKVSAEDSFFRTFGEQCMEFTRSLPAPRRDCSNGHREQLNEITAYIDASQIYGSLDEEAAALREFSGGRLKTFETSDGRDLLPQDLETHECPTETLPCFKAGDIRVNEQAALTVMHTIWMRHHNNLALQLEKLHTDWNDEKIYQETRRIVAAQTQHITYNEFLPVVLGSRYTEDKNLKPLRSGYTNSYDDDVDASISNAFATAAFRLGHNLIEGLFQGYASNGAETFSYQLSTTQFANNFIYDQGTIDGITRGLARTPCQDYDNHFDNEIRNKLFAGNNSFGMDLIALNVQRGREHGLPSYVEFRRACGLGSITSFNQLEREFGSTTVSNLRSVYTSVNDIDLFIGGSLESPDSDNLAGKTFQCILTDQFLRLKRGDRFYYENGDSSVTRFSREQLEEIRKTKLSRIICDNGDNISRIQRNAFLQEQMIQCSDTRALPRLNLSKW